MIRVLLSPLALLMLLCLPASAQLLDTADTIDDVKVRGNRRSEADAILSVTASRAGGRIERPRIRNDIRAIYQLGFYTDVQVDLSTVDGKQVLTFIVTEKPSIRRIVYEGNDEVDDDDLKEVVDLKAFGILDQAKVNRNAEKLKDLYTDKGFFLAEVEWAIIDLPDNEVDVVFRVIEKQEVKVARITIVGNTAMTDAELKEKLETREGGFLAFLSGAGAFKAEAFERDQLRINQFYYDLGYIKARVGKAKVELSADKSELFLTVPLEEGERFKTSTVDLSGDFLKPKEELMRMVALKTDAYFSSSDLRQTISVIGDLYKDEGYAYVNIVPQTMVDDEKKTVGLTIDIERGKKVRFGRIRVMGNSRTRDKVIRRELRIYEGEYFSSTALKRSKRLITRLGFFEKVDLTTTRGADDGTMDVLVEVTEKPTGTFQIGAGFSSLESFVAQAQIAQNNLFGRGQSLSLQFTLSKIRTIANVRFADDYFMDTKVRFATNVYRFENNFTDFTRKSLGGDLTLGYPLSDDISVAGTYTLEEVTVQEGGYGGGTSTRAPIANLFNSGLTSSARFSVFYDTRNNRLFPSSGFFSSASVEEATRLLGSQNQFTRYRLRHRYYYDLGLNLVLKFNAQWGLITSPVKTGVPIFERFFVGGPLTVRGFLRNSLGPTIAVPDFNSPDAGTGVFNTGGTEQVIVNSEIEFPIFQKVGIRGVMFMDAGNSFDRRDAFQAKLDQMRYAWGFGVRWFSPIGPLRFEWGFPFSPRDGEQDQVFDFSIGNFF